jgi:hypothetical protein
MSDLAVVPAEEDVPSVEDIARRISDEGEPDAAVVQIARAVRSRIVAVRHRGEGRSCVSCRHRVSPGTTAAYIGVCVNPVVAEVSYRADSDKMKVSGVDCAEERGVRSGYGKRIHVCGPAGLLHDPMAASGFLPRLRAYLRWRRLDGNIQH